MDTSFQSVAITTMPTDHRYGTAGIIACVLPPRDARERSPRSHPGALRQQSWCEHFLHRLVTQHLKLSDDMTTALEIHIPANYGMYYPPVTEIITDEERRAVEAQTTAAAAQIDSELVDLARTNDDCYDTAGQNLPDPPPSVVTAPEVPLAAVSADMPSAAAASAHLPDVRTARVADPDVTDASEWAQVGHLFLSERTAIACRGYLQLLPEEFNARWGIVKDLLLLFVVDKTYDARGRTVLKRFCSVIDIPWDRVAVAEDALAKLLRRQLNMSGSSDKSNRSAWSKSRWLKVGGAVLVGGTLLAVTGGLAAPALGAGITALGGTAAGTVGSFIAGAGGVAFIASIFGASGAGLGTELYTLWLLEYGCYTSCF